MHMKHKIKYIGISLLIFVFASAVMVFVFRAKIKARFMPEVEQTGDIHIKIKNDTSFISTKLVVKNRSFIKIHINTIKYKVSLFNKIYLQSEKDLGINLPGYGSDSLDFSIKVPYAAILKDLKTERKKEDSTGYAVDITLNYATTFWSSEIPVNKSGKFKIPQPPELKIEDIKWKKVRLKYLLADVKIKFTNHSAIVLSIKDLNYSMEILKHGNLKGNYKEPINIKPNGITFVTIPIEINTKNIGKTIFEVIINKDNYDYILNMGISLKSGDKEGKLYHLDLTNTGKMELKK